MTKLELIKALEKVNDNATVYVEADHGQLPEQQSSVFVACVNKKEYYLEDIDWVGLDEATDEYLEMANVVCIGY